MTAEQDADLSFRPLRREDFSDLSEWLSAPHVQKWWREEFDTGSLEARYGPVIDASDGTECFVVELDGVASGFIQRYRLADNPGWQRTLAEAGTPDDGAGIDFLIGIESLIGVGWGPRIIDRFVESTWVRYPDIPAIVVNVSTENHRSGRALAKAGFTLVWTGVLDSDDPSDAGLNHVYVRSRPDK